jgi:hypothetical protein
VYDDTDKPVLQPGERILFRSVDNVGHVEQIRGAPFVDQAITFTSTPPTGAKVGDTYAPSAIADSGLPVYFQGVDACDVDPDTQNIVMLHVGTCTVWAVQDGDGATNNAFVSQTFRVTRGPQTITFTSTPPANAKAGDTYTPLATGGGSGNPVTIGATGGNCSYNSSTGLVTLDQAGRCIVTADQAGNADYQAAPQAKQVFGGAQLSQTITFSSIAPAFAAVGDTYAPVATASSGLPVIFGTTSGACTYNAASGSVTMQQVGTCAITANQAGDASYAAAPRQKQTIAIVTVPGAPGGFQATGGIRSIALLWASPTDGAASVTSYELTATGGGTIINKGLPVTVCSGGTCSFTLTGLPNGTSFDLTLAARTAAGAGPAASANAATLGLPSAPQSFTATAGNGQSALGWTSAASDGGSPITGYRLRVLANGVVQGTPTELDPASISYTLTGLTNGTRYTLRLTAVTAVGESSVASAAVLLLALPGAPTSFQATRGVRSIALTWAPPLDTGGAAVTSYLLTATAGSIVITKSVSPSTACAASPCAFTLTGLANATSYDLTVAART